MTTAQSVAVLRAELAASAEERAAVVTLVESGELPLGAAPRLGDWTMGNEVGDVLLLSPNPSDDEPIEDAYRSVASLERLLAF
jgi:hypothetical protein